jgi:hypothetical protein
MSTRLLEIYALAVCFVSVGCISIVSGLLIYTLVEITFPSIIAPPAVLYPPPIVEFQQSGTNTGAAIPVPPEPFENLEKTKQFRRMEIDRMKKEAVAGVIKYIVILLVAAIVFWIHWGIARQARENN